MKAIIVMICLFLLSCAQTIPGPEKHSNAVTPTQTINQLTVISPESMEWLIKLSEEDLEKMLKILKQSLQKKQVTGIEIIEIFLKCGNFAVIMQE